VVRGGKAHNSAVSVEAARNLAALERGRASCATGAWVDAHAALLAADEVAPLEADDLELLARAAYMLGSDDGYLRGLERAHYGHLDAGNAPRAARCAWWIGLCLLMLEEAAPARGWFARGERLLEREQADCVEHGYLLLARMLQCFADRDFQGAHDLACEALAIGERFDDRDLVAIGVMDQGHALLELGRTHDGLRLVDESMVAVTSGELSPIVAGILYCNTIAVCRNVFEVRRAREWTTALTDWCERQPDMIAHTGVCLAHRAEIMHMQGAWDEALAEAGRVVTDGVLNRRASAAALYVQGDVHRLRGAFEAAEESYRLAASRGGEPQPGLALLRLVQGKHDAALAAIRRVARETGPSVGRALLLAGYVEIALTAGELDEATTADTELAAIAERQGSDALHAMSAYADGEIALARGEVDRALTRLREALLRWITLEAPYETARTRVLLGRVYAELGDHDGAAMEVQAACTAFEELGARPDLERLSASTRPRESRDAHALSPRELEVLRLLASGATNKAIAATLVLSERTVDRHVSNIYAKLGVSSRAAATARAYEQRLV
jgi:DNA-binding CsgD family transcriptional regulator